MDRTAHWRQLYEAKAEDEVSWFQQVPATSLAMIERAGLAADAAVIDVGGGASRLVDALLERGFRRLSVLDLAGPALERSRRRLGPRAEQVRWIVADVTSWTPDQAYDLWHDRAVFHFLTDAGDRAAYRRTLLAAVPPGGSVIIAAFAPDGPERCSGLPVIRYDAAALAGELGAGLRLVEEVAEDHMTPAGKVQRFRFARFLRE